MIPDIITDKKSLFAEDTNTELRAQMNWNRRISLIAGNLTSNSRSHASGVSARVYKNGVYGFSSVAEYNENAVRKVLEAATENARFLGNRAGKNKGMFPKLTSGQKFVKEDISDVEQTAYIEYAKCLDQYIAEKYPSLASRAISVSADCMEKLLSVSNGFDSHSIMPRSYIYVSMTAMTDQGKPVELFEPIGGFGTFDQNFTNPADHYGVIDKLYENLMKKREGVYAQAGVKTCVLSGQLTGMLAHEAVGHTVEADLVIGGSVAGKMLHKQVASDLITMVDFAHTAFGNPAPLPVYVDDEGVEAEDALLIKNGILMGYMNNRESAERFGMKPQGNARAYSFSDEPLIRMRNTAVLPGRSKVEDMIASIEDGYYFTDTNNGQADMTGEFMFGVTGGYEIKKGKLGRAILDTTISGVAFDMLKTVDMVSDEVEWSSSGYCGKKQPMPVGLGGPAVRCRITVGGK